MLNNIKDKFPIYKKNPNLVFLDTAASALKPESVIKSISDCYSYEYSNVHRGIYSLSSNITKKFEEVRDKTAKFISAESGENIIFTKSATEAINLVAETYSKKFISSGDEVLISYLEHHANIVPWQMAAIKYGFKVVAADISKNGSLNIDDLINKINSNTKFISLTHMSNVTGSITNFEKISKIANKKNIPLLIDGCQHVAHKKINMDDLNCDFYVYSGHKLYGPTGVGVLYMKNKWFEKLEPYQGGGAMIDKVDIDSTTFASGFQKFEAGTPPIVQVIGLGSSFDFLNQYNLDDVFNHEKNLYNITYEKLKSINDLIVYGDLDEKGGILTFNISNINANDIALFLDQHGVAIRTGHHCAQPLMKKFNVNSTARISFGIYNDEKDIDHFIDSLSETRKLLLK